MNNTPAYDRAKAVHCRQTMILGLQCSVCRYSTVIKDRPAYVVCNRLQLEIPSNYTCDDMEEENEKMTTQYDIKPCPHCGEAQSITIFVNNALTSYIACTCGARVQINNYDATPGQMLYDLISLWNRRVEE